MENRLRKKLMTIVAALLFIGMMGLSITSSNNNTDFSVTGIQAIASGSTGSATCYSTYSGCWFYNCWQVFLCESDGECQDSRTSVDSASDACSGSE